MKKSCERDGRRMKKLFQAFLFVGAIWFCMPGAMAQTRQVTGTVSDANGPVIGATVMVEGTTTGTNTDGQGRYRINMPQAGGTLTFSFMGYTTQQVRVTNQTAVDVVLQEAATDLDDVVVIGYGTARKRDLTGSVVSMKADDIVIAPTTNVMEALQGKISGMDIVRSSGQLGSEMNVLLRGNRSIYGSNTPLFIIDGIPGSYDSVNPSDIESVDVLKDASSTAIYGSAGANGVVIITTKRGKEGKVTVNFDAYYGFSGKPEYKHGMTGQEWVDYRREAYKYQNGQYPSDMGAILTDPDKLALYNAGKWIDWVDEAAGRTATTQRYNLSVTGGNAKTRLYASMSYEKEEGLLRNEDRNRYSLRTNIDQEIFEWASIGVTSNLVYGLQNRGMSNTFTNSISRFPLGDPYNEDGSIKYEYAPKHYTPLGDFIYNQYVNETRSTAINANAYLELRPLKGLTFRTTVNGILSNSRAGRYWGKQANASLPTYASTPHASINNRYGYGYTWENILSYNTTIAEDHNISATLVTSWNKSQDEANLNEGSGQQLDSWSFYRLMSATDQHIESSYSQTQKMSYAGRVNYSYKGKYLFSASIRRDGVSWLSEGHKWDNFPAVSAAWRISDEAFMKSSSDWLSNLKLRVGYGVTGNSGGVGAYSTLTTSYAYSSAGISIDGQIVPFNQYTGTYGNPGLGWEKSYNLNIGVDLGLFDQRIDLAVDWFTTKTKDLLFSRRMPVTSGVTGWGAPLSSWENIAETSNKGIEFTLNTRNFVKRDFTWNTTLTFTYSKEKIESLPAGDLPAESLFIGEPIKSRYGYKYAGIWGTDASQADLDLYGVKPGWVKIETTDQNGDGGRHQYNTNDRQILGHSNPDYIIGLNNTFTYKNFDLTVFAMARYGQTINSDLLGWYNSRIGDDNNQLSGTNYWTENNQGAHYPVPGYATEQSTYLGAVTIFDGSFIKVKNITLGYTLPKNISRIAKMERLRIYATAYNPFIYTKEKELKGTDPETGGSDSFPLYRQFVFGINITF